MSLINHLKKARLTLLNNVEPKEDVLDVVFKTNINTLSLSNLEAFLISLEGEFKKSEKLEINNQVLSGIENKEFFQELPSNIYEADCLIYFYCDTQNLVDYYHIFIFNENICSYEAYDFSGKSIIKGQRAINNALPFNRESKTIKKLYSDSIFSVLSKEKRHRYSEDGHLKSDSQRFIEVLNKEKISKLYHFTDKSNIESILKHGGLYSWAECDQKNIRICSPGGNSLSRSLDSYYGLEDYVRLSFNKNNPMMYAAQKDKRIQDPVILEINPDVLLWESSLFSDRNATTNGHSLGPSLDDFLCIKFSLAKQDKYSTITDSEKPYFQAEVLVKSHIPTDYITNLTT